MDCKGIIFFFIKRIFFQIYFTNSLSWLNYVIRFFSMFNNFFFHYRQNIGKIQLHFVRQRCHCFSPILSIKLIRLSKTWLVICRPIRTKSFAYRTILTPSFANLPSALEIILSMRFGYILDNKCNITLTCDVSFPFFFTHGAWLQVSPSLTG